MRICRMILTSIIIILCQNLAIADSQLDDSQIEQIITTLTDQPRCTWIPYGTIEAQHTEYNVQHGYSADSSVIVRFDGDRFYWEINTSSIEKTAQQSILSPTTFRDKNTPGWSKKRIFVWDGQQYTMYFGPGRQAVVTEDTGQIPVEINGPLTAGIIPWGFGIYTHDSLSAAESSAVELDLDGQQKVYLELSMPRIPEMYTTLDASKDYAVLSHSYVTDEGYSIEYTCSDYEQVSDRWIPKEILIERYDYSKNPAKLLSWDHWLISSVDISQPPLSAFKASYDKGTLVQYYPEMFKKPFSYHHSNDVNIEDLLCESMVNTFAENSNTRNCATAAVKYTASKCEKGISDSSLAQIVTGSDQTTSLYEIKHLLQQQGLYCEAVQTDIKHLKSLKNDYQVILHLSEIDHYAVLHDIDVKYVWLIDLNRKHFFYRKKIKDFNTDWSEGTALLVSQDPVNTQPDTSTISDEKLHGIIGSDGFGNYSCSKLIQSADEVFCSIICGGQYSIYFELYACEPDGNGGSCSGEPMLSRVSLLCLPDPSDPLFCLTPGDWIDYYIRACQQ